MPPEDVLRQPLKTSHPEDTDPKPPDPPRFAPDEEAVSLSRARSAEMHS